MTSHLGDSERAGEGNDIPGGRIVHVEGIEIGEDEDSGGKKAEFGKSEEFVHDGENVKTTYTVEEDTPPSLYQKLKEIFTGIEGKLRHKKAEDPTLVDPNLESALNPVMSREIDPRVVDPSENLASDENPETESRGAGPMEGKSANSTLERFSSSKSHFEVEQKTGSNTDEQDIGHQQDCDDSASTLDDASPHPSLPHTSAALFKPSAPQGESGTTLEAVRCSKLNQNAGVDDVKAPGLLGRAKEEVDALAENLSENLDLKDNRAGSADAENSGQSGFFSRIAGKVGYGSHERSQSH